jgi:hypothetical protein
MAYFDLETDFDSYAYGFIIADGSLNLNTRNRGRLQVEIKYSDLDLLRQFQSAYGGSIRTRERVTNYSKGELYKTATWTQCKLDFRTELISYGYPIKNKSITASSPKVLVYDDVAFWRGYIDGNGSLGMTARGIPFVSATIKSEWLKSSYLVFIHKYLGIDLKVSRNKRDNIYNIMISNAGGEELAMLLYSNATVYLQRKYDKYMDIISCINNKSIT